MTAFGKFLENNTESQPLHPIMVNSILLKNLCASNDIGKDSVQNRVVSTTHLPDCVLRICKDSYRF